MLAAFLSIATALSGAAARTLPTKPTVLHIVADDLGYADLG